jgi:hypothetical protein
MMKTRLGILITVAALLATSCASMGGAMNPNQQIEGRVAFYARQVIGMADNALTMVDIVTDQRLAMAAADPAKQERIKADARAVITVFKQIGEGGQKLAAALTAVDQALTNVDRTNAIQVAQGVMAGLNRLVTDGTMNVGDDTTRSVVLRLFGNVSDLLLQLAFILPRPAAA